MLFISLMLTTCRINRDSRNNLLKTLFLAAILTNITTLTAHSKAYDDQPASKKLSMDLSEGTWISLDVDRTNDEIVFELLGEIYSLPAKGGKAKLLIGGAGYASMPSISPNGKWIAFVSDRDGSDNLWIASRDGKKVEKLTDYTYATVISPSWSPDSSQIVFTIDDDGSELITKHIAGGDGIVLKSISGQGNEEESLAGIGAVFSADGNSIYYTSWPDSDTDIPAGQISRFDFKSRKIVQVTQSVGGGVKPSVSPDGKYLAYVSRYDSKSGLRIRNLEDGSDKLLLWPIQRDSQEAGSINSRDFFPSYSFTNNSDAVLLNDDGKLSRVDINTGKRDLVSFKAKVELDIAPRAKTSYRLSDLEGSARIVHNPAVSPKSNNYAASVLGKIYVGDGQKAPTRITDSDHWEFKPQWSLDGNSIIYITWSAEKGGHIWKKFLHKDAGPAIKLTEQPAHYLQAIVSKDGKYLLGLKGSAFLRNQKYSEFLEPDYPLEIFKMPIEGGRQSVIYSTTKARELHLGPEPNRLYFSENLKLKSINLAGDDLREHARISPASGYQPWGPHPMRNYLKISPLGDRVLILTNDQLYISTMPPYSSSSVELNVEGSILPIERLTDTGADFFGWLFDKNQVYWSVGSTIYQRDISNVFDKVIQETKTSAEATQRAEDDPAVSKSDFKVRIDSKAPIGNVLLKGGEIVSFEDADRDNFQAKPIKGNILITGNRIAAIGKAGSFAVPNGTTEIDVSGNYILPGFIDTHAHHEMRTGDILEPHNWSLIANLAYGVTTSFDVQTYHKDYFTYADLVASGEIPGSRFLTTGRGVFGENDFKSYESVLFYLKRYSDHYRTKNIKAYLTGNREQRQWVAKAARTLGLIPTTEGAGDLRLMLTHAIDGMRGNEHNIPIAPIYDDIARFLGKTNTTYTPTLVTQYNGLDLVDYFFTKNKVRDDIKLRRFYPHNRLNELTLRRSIWAQDVEYTYKDVANSAAKLRRAGVLVGVGGHGELQGLGYHWELLGLASSGMTNSEVLRAATIDGAKIVGIAEDVGSIEAGKRADLIVLQKNPIIDIKNTQTLKYVIRDGFIYDANTADKIWPTKETLKPFWWWKQTESEYKK